MNFDDSLYNEYKDILEKFEAKSEETQNEPEKPQVYYEDDDDGIPDEEEETKPKLSKKKRKQMNKISIAELKAMVSKPEIVEWTDADAADPKLLVRIKAHRNVVPVPSHWSLKREYLSPIK